MSKNKIFTLFIIGFLVGILFSNFLFVFSYIFYFLVVIFVLFFGLIYFAKKYHLFIIIVVFGIFLGSIYSSINNYFISKKTAQIEYFYDKKVTIIGEILNTYSLKDTTNTYIVDLNIIDKTALKNIYFLLKVPNNFNYEKGDIISLNGQLSRIENFNETFNYNKFLLSKNIYFSVNYAKVSYINKKINNGFFSFIDNFKKSFLDKIYNIYPKNEADFLAGILIGHKDNFSTDMLNNYNNSGLTHLISVSGFNITIIIIFLGSIIKFLPIFLRSIIIIFFVIFFTILVGIENIAVIRASIMGIIGYLIISLGRKGDSLIILLFTSFLLVLYNPLSINYDTSFHLSFLAVCGLLYTQDFWNKVFGFLPKFFAIKESFVLTMSAFSTTLPIMIFSFGKISIVSPLSNMFVGGVMPFAMFFGFLSILGSYINNYLGYLIGYIGFFILRFINFVASFFGNLSFASISYDFGFLSIYLEILYFMILLYFIINFTQEKK